MTSNDLSKSQLYWTRFSRIDNEVNFVNSTFIGFYSLSHHNFSFSLLRVDILFYFNQGCAKVKDELLGVLLNVVLK